MRPQYEVNGITFVIDEHIIDIPEGWPNDVEKEGMAICANAMHKVAEITGKAFNPTVPVYCNAPGRVVTDADKNLALDNSFFTNELPTLHDDIEGFILHEGAHLNFDDARTAINLGTPEMLLSSFKSFYNRWNEDKEEFVRIIKSAHPDTDNYIQKTQELAEQVNNLTQPLMSKVSGIKTVNTKSVLSWLYENTGALIDIPTLSDNTIFSETLGYTTMPFMAKISAQFDTNLPMPSYDHIELSDEELQNFNALMEKLKPVIEAAEKLETFSRSYVHATEHRADDFAMMYATKPALYPEAMGRMIAHITKLLEEMGSHPIEEGQTHPTLAERQARCQLVMKKLNAARLIDPDITPESVIPEVNRAWSPTKNEPYLPPF